MRGREGGRGCSFSTNESPLPLIDFIFLDDCSNGQAAKALTEIGNPPVDWVKLAQVRRGGTKVAGGDRARQPAFKLKPTSLPFISLQGMGLEAARADTSEQLAALVTAALDRPGPYLIEAWL